MDSDLERAEDGARDAPGRGGWRKRSLAAVALLCLVAVAGLVLGSMVLVSDRPDVVNPGQRYRLDPKKLTKSVSAQLSIWGLSNAKAVCPGESVIKGQALTCRFTLNGVQREFVVQVLGPGISDSRYSLGKGLYATEWMKQVASSQLPIQGGNLANCSRGGIFYDPNPDGVIMTCDVKLADGTTQKGGAVAETTPDASLPGGYVWVTDAQAVVLARTRNAEAAVRDAGTGKGDASKAPADATGVAKSLGGLLESSTTIDAGSFGGPLVTSTAYPNWKVVTTGAMPKAGVQFQSGPNTAGLAYLAYVVRDTAGHCAGGVLVGDPADNVIKSTAPRHLTVVAGPLGACTAAAVLQGAGVVPKTITLPSH